MKDSDSRIGIFMKDSNSRIGNYLGEYVDKPRAVGVPA